METCADAVLVFSCPQEVCELDACLWKHVLMLSLCFPALSSVGVCTCYMSVESCADAVLVFSCPQLVCELDACLWKLVLMLSLCFPALRECVNLMHVCGHLC